MGDDARIEVATLQDGDCDVLPGGFSYEVQTVYLASLSPVTGSFTLNFEGQETGPIAVGATAAEVKARLEALDTIFATNVRMEDLDTNLNTRAWTVTFTHQRHTLTQGAADANLMVGTTNFGETTAEVHVTERVAAATPRVRVLGLTAGREYHARVTAYNRAGYGPVSAEVAASRRRRPRRRTRSASPSAPARR